MQGADLGITVVWGARAWLNFSQPEFGGTVGPVDDQLEHGLSRTHL